MKDAGAPAQVLERIVLYWRNYSGGKLVPIHITDSGDIVSTSELKLRSRNRAL